MKKNSASTLLAVLAMLVTLSACVIAALNYTSVVSRNVMRTNALRGATEVGDGALDYAFVHWRELCREQMNTARPTSDFSALPLPTQSLFPGVSNFTASAGPNPASGTPFTVANYKVKAVDPQMADLATTATPPTPGTGTQIGDVSFYYLASADVTLPAFAGKPVSVKLRRVFEKQLQSPWNYAIFYNDLLEIHPSPPFTVTGWVHTNGDLYTAHNTLTFASKVDYGSDWGIAFAPGDVSHPETPASPNYPSNLPPAKGSVQQPFGIDPQQVASASGSTMTADQVYHALIEPGTSNVFGNNSYYNQADVRILVNGSNTVTIKNGSDVTVNASSTGNNLALYNVFKSAVATNGSIQDNREGATMRIVTLDMGIISKALTPTSQGGTGQLVGTGFSGVIYATDTSGSATVKRGIRLKNGASMPPGGLTVASNNPIYVQGDYNTGRTASAETPANLNNDNTGSNTVSGYTEQPCAILGDAVMVLSNAWTDLNSTSDVSSRIATPTTINSAIVSGIVPSGGGAGANSYSGGAENFPRFMETWTGNTFTYYGSMVELFKSQQNTGYWGSANVYNPPHRNWYFDTLFYTNPPPGTLTLYSYNKQRWFVQ